MNPGQLYWQKLPAPAQTLLLRCALQRGAAVAANWRTWLDGVDGPSVLLEKNCADNIRGLNGLLLESLERNAIDPGPKVRTTMRTLQLRESMRSRIYWEIGVEALEVLDRAQVPFVLLKGAALAATVYPRVELRHAHDLDLLVGDADLAHAASALRALPVARQRTIGDGHVQLLHETGLPICLHVNPLSVAHVPGLAGAFWPRAMPRTVAGRSLRVLAPEDNVLHVAVQAFLNRERRNLRWVSDLWFLLEREPGIDWQRLLDTARDLHLAPMLQVMLDYVHGALGAPVPSSVLEGLRQCADRDVYGRDLAMASLWSESRRNPAALLDMLGGRALRRDVARWILAPCRRYAQLRRGKSSRAATAVEYVLRPLRFASRRVGRLAARVSRGGG